MPFLKKKDDKKDDKPKGFQDVAMGYAQGVHAKREEDYKRQKEIEKKMKKDQKGRKGPQAKSTAGSRPSKKDDAKTALKVAKFIAKNK